MPSLKSLLELRDKEEQKLLKFEQARLTALKLYQEAEVTGNNKNNTSLKANLSSSELKVNDAQAHYKLASDNLQNRLEEVNRRVSELSSLIENQKPPLDSKRKDQLKIWEKQLSEATKDINEYKKAVLTKAPKEEQLYQKEKERFFDIVNSILKDPKGLNNIVSPLASYQKEKKGIGVGDIAATGLNAIGFLASNRVVNVFDIPHLKSFYPEEIDKFRKFLSGKEKFYSNNLPFFARLIQDKDFKDFLAANSANLNNIIETITPTLSAIALKQLGRIDALEEKLKSKEKELKNLPVLEKELKRLQQPPISTANSNKIDALTEEIRPLRSLLNNVQIARFIANLENIGITKDYVNQKLVPVILDLPTKILKDPKDFSNLTTVAISYVLAQDEIQKKAALGQVLDEIDPSKLLENLKLVDFLKTEVPTLTRAATNVVESTPTLKDRLANYNISNNLVANAIPLATKISSTILQDLQGIAKLYEALKPVLLDDTTIKLKQTTNEKEIELLKNQRFKKLKDASDGLAQVLLNEDVLKIVLKETPAFLEGNKVALTEVAIAAIPKVLGKLSNDVSPAIYSAITPLAINLITNILRDLDGAKINDIYKNVSDVISNEGRAQALADLLTVGSKLLESPGTVKVLSQDLPNLLLTEDAQKAIGQLAENFTMSNKKIKDRLENLHVSSNLIKNALPFITSISSIALQEINISKVIESLAPIISDDTVDRIKQAKTPQEVESLKQIRSEKVSKMLDTIPDLVLRDNFLKAVTKEMPDFFEKNKVELSQTVAAAIPSALGKLSDSVAPEVYKSVAPLAIDLTGNILKDLDPPKIHTIFKNVINIARNKDRLNSINSLLITGEKILESPTTLKVFSEDLPNLLQDKNIQLALNQVVENLVETNITIKNQLDLYNIPDNLVKNAIPFATNIASACLNELPKLIDVYAEFKHAQDLNISAGSRTNLEEKDVLKLKGQEIIAEMLTKTQLVLANENLQTFLKTNLPTYLSENKESLVKVVGEITVKNDQVRSLLSTNYITATLVKEVTEVSLDFIADAIPLVNKIGQEALSNPSELSKIITHAQGITKAPEKERKQEILKLVSSIIDFKNNNTALNDTIEQELPTLLIKHADKLGSAADKFLHETKIGKKLNVKGEEIIKLASNHLPELSEIADLYSKRRYAAIIPKATKLLFKKDVLEIVSKAVVGLIKTDNKAKTTPSNTEITTLNDNLEKNIRLSEDTKELAKETSKHIQLATTKQASDKENSWLKKIMNKRQMEKSKPTNKISKG